MKKNKFLFVAGLILTVVLSACAKSDTSDKPTEHTIEAETEIKSSSDIDTIEPPAAPQ